MTELFLLKRQLNETMTNFLRQKNGIRIAFSPIMRFSDLIRNRTCDEIFLGAQLQPVPRKESDVLHGQYRQPCHSQDTLNA